VKRNLRLTLGALFFFASALSSCGDQLRPVVVIDKTVRPTGSIVEVGFGVDKSGRFDLALEKAILDGKAKVAADVAKRYGRTGGGSVPNAVIREILRGVQVLSVPKQRTYSNRPEVDVSVLVGIDRNWVTRALLPKDSTVPVSPLRGR